jgi:hypothetical protein
MAPDGVFPHEMPDDLPTPTDPLDDDTAERLLAGRLPPEDAPPPYARVARVLRAAAGPPTPEELAGEAAALAAFRTVQRSAGRPGRHGAARGRHPAHPTGPPRAAGRARVVALALAGTLAVGGLWMAAGAQTAPGLRSPTGGPGAAGSGSRAAGSGVAGSWTTGSLRPAMPATGPVTGDGSPALPSARDPAAARGGAATGGAHRSHPAHPGKPPKARPKPRKAKPDKPAPEKPRPEKPSRG